MRTRTSALLTAFAVAAAAVACGGDDGAQGASATVDAGVKAGVDAALGSSTTAGGSATADEAAERPSSIEEWEELWAEEREAAIERITSNGWGKTADGTKLVGPEGFEVDLAACAPGWSDTEGITDSTIKLGHTNAFSGTAADYGNIARGMDVVLRHYSDAGFFTDADGRTRKVDFLYKDDGYDPARTIPLVDELIDSERVFAVLTMGSPTGLKVYDKLSQRCIPHPLAMSGHPGWGDPVNHPWTTGQQMAYNTEAVLWGAFIEQRIDEFGDGPVKIASLVSNSDFGVAYDSFFRAYLDQSPHRDRFEYVSELVEISAPTVTDPMTTLAAERPDVFITMTGGAQCPQIIQQAAQNGMKDTAKYLFMSSVCKAASFVGKEKVGGDGMAADGWWIMGGGAIDFNAEASGDDPYVAWGRKLLTDADIDWKTSGSYGTGFLFAFPLVQSLRIAGELPGGLTRTNFLVALRSFDMTNPMLLPGIEYNMNGNADAYLTEGSDISRFDAAAQQWVQQGAIIDLSGKSANCAYDQSTSTCA